ncbi:thiamine biosynthesis protein ApbE, partial [Neisseria meningitidis]
MPLMPFRRHRHRNISAVLRYNSNHLPKPSNTMPSETRLPNFIRVLIFALG